jgi:hypothetical protein
MVILLSLPTGKFGEMKDEFLYPGAVLLERVFLPDMI